MMYFWSIPLFSDTLTHVSFGLVLVFTVIHQGLPESRVDITLAKYQISVGVAIINHYPILRFYPHYLHKIPVKPSMNFTLNLH